MYKPPKQPSRAHLQRIVDRFNRSFPVGSRVILRKDTGEVETTVKAPAEVLSGHSAVGWFEGVRGCYSIEDNRVSAVGKTQPAV
jgi:hypothetical protein